MGGYKIGVLGGQRRWPREAEWEINSLTAQFPSHQSRLCSVLCGGQSRPFSFHLDMW